MPSNASEDLTSLNANDTSSLSERLIVLKKRIQQCSRTLFERFFKSGAFGGANEDHQELSASEQSKRSLWGRRFTLLLFVWVVFIALPSFKPFRAVLIAPLYVHHEDAKGDYAYVMADGYAYYERLRAASDLYHWDRVQQIYISDEKASSGYHFALKRSISRAEKARMILAMWGVPKSAVSTIPMQESALLGSSSEAHSFAENTSEEKSVVVVTSAPHTRRSLLCFQRIFPVDQVAIYSASQPVDSAEIESAIWLEYLKLALYYVLA